MRHIGSNALQFPGCVVKFLKNQKKKITHILIGSNRKERVEKYVWYCRIYRK